MANCLVFITGLAVLIFYDFSLRLRLLFAPKDKAFDVCEQTVQIVAARLFRLMEHYAGAQIEVENCSGKPLPERFILVSNHQSLLDIPLLTLVLSPHPLLFIAKKELGLGIPYISFVLRNHGHALIHRKGDASRAMRSIQKLARLSLEDGANPAVFPEGTRSRDGEVGVFHTAGVRKILDETPLPMVVAVLDGSSRLATAKKLFANLKGSRFQVKILRVTETLSSKREVLSALDAARSDIVAGLAQMRSEEADAADGASHGSSSLGK